MISSKMGVWQHFCGSYIMGVYRFNGTWNYSGMVEQWSGGMVE
jgi:hypothetical protein